MSAYEIYAGIGCIYSDRCISDADPIVQDFHGRYSGMRSKKKKMSVMPSNEGSSAIIRFFCVLREKRQELTGGI